jgi:hypothetical protein
MYSGFINIAGTLPQLKFQQTTSGSAYNNNDAGIKCYAGSSSGMHMTIQTGYNMIIGGGSYPTNFYNATKNSIDSWSNTGGRLYLGADTSVHVHTNGGTIGSRHTFSFGNTGTFAIAPGGDLVIKRGTEASPVSHTLTTAATTTARTWTLPNATGTLALTSDIPTAVSFTCTSANTTNYKIDKQRCYCIFGKFVVINMSITTSTTFAANTAYSIATIPSAYTAGSSYVVIGTGHYQVGSPVTPTVSTWVNGTSIKFSTTTANSTSSAKTIRVSFTYAMS